MLYAHSTFPRLRRSWSPESPSFSETRIVGFWGACDVSRLMLVVVGMDGLCVLVRTLVMMRGTRGEL